jgi:hypothetical protein
MEVELKKTRHLLVAAILLLCILPAFAQVKKPVSKTPAPAISKKLAEFNHLTAGANVVFIFPKGFREVKAPENEDFSFDYGMELPGKEFEIWFQVKSEKENWASYIKNQNNQNTQLTNPDSLYTGMGQANANALTGDKNYFVRTIPADMLARYNADAGKSYLLTLLDLPETRHYKYALLITLQKNHTGTILAVCFTNEKGPEFFKNIDRASNCIRFKP